MAEAEARKPVPAITPEAKPFWEAAAQQKLKIQRCNDCRAWVWTPRPSCVECGSENVAWTDMSGKGEVYSFSVIRQIVGRGVSQAFQKDIPYVVAWVDLDEGPRLITNIVGCPVEDVKLGMKVSVVSSRLRRKYGCPSSSLHERARHGAPGAAPYRAWFQTFQSLLVVQFSSRSRTLFEMTDPLLLSFRATARNLSSL